MDVKEIKLIKIDSSHIKELQQISAQTFIESYAPVNTKENVEKYVSICYSEKKLIEEINNPNSEFYFAKLSKKIIGYLKINFREAQTELMDNKGLEIERIYVSKEFKGKKIGQLFFEKAVEIAKQNNLQYIWLGVWENNYSAIKFYKKIGFIQFGAHPFKFGDDDQIDTMMKFILKD